MTKKSFENERKQFKVVAKRLIDEAKGTKRTLFRVKEGKGLT